ncbi:MAG: DUF421 domain-containing protein [Lachnospiraceae bacterium]|jgi:uncharacterized membrane protein YcaP (DUF421 family)|nr:DUF421 domain-containing protein [Lachnospiraceae bacterium]
MYVIFVRTIILYILILVAMRLMGKSEIGQLQPFEFTVAIMIADLASIPMSDTGIPLLNGIIPILTLLMLQILISVLSMKSTLARKIFSGKPAILIDNGKIDAKNLRRERITLNELQERLRQANVFTIGDVEFAILETSGELTVILKPEKRPLIPEDMSIIPEYEGLPYDLVLDGKIMGENLKKIGKNYVWLKKQVEKFGYKPEEALIVTYDGKKQIFCQKKES